MIPDTSAMDNWSFGGGGGGAGGAGPNMNALMSIMLLGQSIYGHGQDTSKPIDMATPMSGYLGNINKAKMLEQLLGKGGKKDQNSELMSLIKDAFNPDSATTMKIDGKGLTSFHEASKFLEGNDPYGAVTGPKFGATSSAGGPTPTSAGGGPAAQSPFSVGQETGSGLDNITADDLVGLTTKDVMDMLSAKHSQEQLRQQSYRDIMDAIYKGSTMKRASEAAEVDIPYKRALTRESVLRAEAETPTIAVEGVPFKMNQKDFLAYQKLNKDDKTAAVKNYEFAQGQGFKGTFTEFQDMAKTTHKKDYDEAVKDGYKGSFNTWMTEMAKAGAINLGTKIEEKEAFNALETQNYFSSGKFNTEIGKAAAEYSKADLWNFSIEKRSAELTKFKAKSVVDSIIARGGEIQSAEWDKDGKTMVWEVRWPNKKSQTIKYPLK